MTLGTAKTQISPKDMYVPPPRACVTQVFTKELLLYKPAPRQALLLQAKLPAQVAAKETVSKSGACGHRV